MLYDLLQEPLEPGSVLEAVCLMVQARRETTELLKTYTLIQAIRAGDDAAALQEAFARYRSSQMPYLEDELNKEKKSMAELLREEIRQAPMLKVTVPTEARASSALRRRLTRKNPRSLPGGKA